MPCKPIAHRRGFTLVEVIVASVITAFVMGSVSMSLAQLSRAKSTTKERLDAYLRADVALESLRRDVASVLRSDDLFWTRLLIEDRSITTPLGQLDRDEILLFTTRMRPLHDIDFNGEGVEYETQYRIEVDDLGPVLWQRRDSVPDEHPGAGGMLTPLVEGIIGLMIEAYDGTQWYDDWDSDKDGLPWALRLTVTASGHRNAEDVFEAPVAILSTIVAIDRVVPPPQEEVEEEEEDKDATTGDQAEGAETTDEGTIGRPSRGRGRRDGRDLRPDGRRPDLPPGAPRRRPDGNRPSAPGPGGSNDGSSVGGGT